MAAHRGVWVAGDAKHMGAIFEGTEPKGAKFGAIGHMFPPNTPRAPHRRSGDGEGPQLLPGCGQNSSG